MRRAALLVSLVALIVPAATTPSRATASRAAAKVTLSRKLTKALSAQGLVRTRTAAYAVDLRTGEVVYAYNASRPLHPASVEKLSVLYGALSALGPTFRFHTELLGQGHRGGATWHGDLVLRGYGDPTLSSSDIRALARRIRAQGIRRVQGRILGDESFFDSRRTAAGWKSYYYMNESPPLSALVTDRAIYQGRMTRWPAKASALELRHALKSAGVYVTGRASAAQRSSNGAGTVLGASHSAPLWKIVRYMAQESDNFTAEMVVKELGAMQGPGGTTPGGVSVIRDLLGYEGIALGGVRLVDGSGLSRLDRLTTRTLGDLLESAWASPTLHKPFIGALAVAGRNGTLSQRLTGPATRGQIIAKTGTTLVSSSLAGFVKGRYAFAIINNGSPINAWTARVAQDRFVTVLAHAA